LFSGLLARRQYVGISVFPFFSVPLISPVLPMCRDFPCWLPSSRYSAVILSALVCLWDPPRPWPPPFDTRTDAVRPGLKTRLATGPHLPFSPSSSSLFPFVRSSFFILPACDDSWPATVIGPSLFGVDEGGADQGLQRVLSVHFRLLGPALEERFPSLRAAPYIPH